jgi:hypothetical protein
VEETADQDTIEAKDATVAEIVEETADGDGADVLDVVEAGAGAATAVIQAAEGICRRRSTHHLRVTAILAATITDADRSIAGRGLRRRASRVKTTLCCRASR